MTSMRAKTESANIHSPAGVILPGGCILELDKLGLPTSPNIKHSADICLCHNHQDEIYIKYLIMWQAKYSEELQLDKTKATTMACRLIEEWKLKVPRWLEPSVQQWAELLKEQGK